MSTLRPGSRCLAPAVTQSVLADIVFGAEPTTVWDRPVILRYSIGPDDTGATVWCVRFEDFEGGFGYFSEPELHRLVLDELVDALNAPDDLDPTDV